MPSVVAILLAVALLGALAVNGYRGNERAAVAREGMAQALETLAAAQSLENASLALPVTNPWLFFSDYVVDLSDADTDRVGSETPDVWVTVRAGSSPADFSANLRAPILVADGYGHQVINEAKDAPVRAALFPEADVEQAA